MKLVLGDAQRARLHDTFAALCRIPSPTGRERACADWVSAALRGLGLAVEEDQAGAAIGADAGNLLARIEGRGADWMLLCAHLDTVPPSAPIEPVQRNGSWRNANNGILGADNKAAVAALVELARILTTGGQRPQLGVELLFTVSEETGLRGAGEFDIGALRSSFGYVFDHATPWGGIVHSSPTHMRIRAEIRGVAAHAGLQPERGVSAIRAAAVAVSAMPHGRIDAHTTANVGTIEGGTAGNVVPDRCSLEGEIRSSEQPRLDTVLTATIDALQDAADSAGCDLDLDIRRMFAGYRLSRKDRALTHAQRALRALGIEPQAIDSGGGADANVMREHGFDCANIANGTERPHERDECVSAAALETGLEVALALTREVEA